MKTSPINWKELSIPFNNSLNDALQQQHHAAQFIAMVGHYLIPQKPDDSNTNMSFVAEHYLLVGNVLPNGLKIALTLVDLKIKILDQENKIRKEIFLQGKSKKEAFYELKNNLADLGVDVANLKNELHYNIPSHQLDDGAVFNVINENNFIENTLYRHNAQIVIENIAKDFTNSEPVKIWPHHFDTGSFIPVSKNKQGKLSQSIGIGWGMPDGMVNEPYYYLSFWSEKPIQGLKKLKPLEAGEWKVPEWNGAVLKHSEIIKAGTGANQFKIINSFFDSGIKILYYLLKDKLQ